jgi:prolyl-tRNA synthetase
MAMPVIKGVKTESDRFAGALDTYTIEALMQDGKALQAGTSHFLGQNFAEAFDVKFTNKEGKQDHVWATSWGVSTRLIGGLIMTHSDDFGLVLPPKLAPIQVVIVPIHRNDEQLEAVSEKALEIVAGLKKRGVSIKFDNRTTHKPGWKFAEYELKGVPLRIAMGPRDLENGTLELARRDTLEKNSFAQVGIEDVVVSLLEEIQENLFKKAKDYRDEHITKVDTFEEFKKALESKGGFILAHWDGTEETEDKIKELTKATIRCIANDAENEEGKCVYSGKPSSKRVLFAKAY